VNAQKTYLVIMTCGVLSVGLAAAGAFSHYRRSVVSYARQRLVESEARQVAAWTGCTGYASGMLPITSKAAEYYQVDVPAIQVSDGQSFAGPCLDRKGRMMDGYCVIPRWTCAVKTRILLTAEDGSKHCVKFSTEPPQ
jgi:hypothetical protein